MIKSSFVLWTCNKCNSLSEIPLDDFLHPDYECGKPVLATCESCNCDSTITLKGVLTQ